MPHELIDAFQSTLDAAVDADLLIHVVDLSDPDWEHKMQVTMDTLHTIHADEIPLLRVFNKCDLLTEEHHENGIMTSCVTGQGIEEMTRKILDMLYPIEDEGDFEIPYARLGDYEKYAVVLRTKVLDHTAQGMIVHMAGERQYLDIFRHDRRR